VASPVSMQPRREYVQRARAYAAENGGGVSIVDDALEAAWDADVLYTDVWVSMGREAEAKSREQELRPYQVNTELMARAHPDAIFMHCLPAHIGEEVTAEVAYGSQSVIFEQAENRLHVQKALMLQLLDSREGGH